MITRIEIDGFKSFRQFHLDLEPFQVIVGLNAAGKSNLLDAFRFIAKVVTTDVKTAYQEMWAATGELFTMLPDGKTAERMSFALEFLVERAVTTPDLATGLGYTRVRYELAVRRSDGPPGPELVVENERLVGITAENDIWANDRPGEAWAAFLGLIQRPGALFPIKVLMYLDAAAEPVERTLVALRGATVLGRHYIFSPIVEAVFRATEQTTFLDIEPEAVRSPVSAQGPSHLK